MAADTDQAAIEAVEMATIALLRAFGTRVASGRIGRVVILRRATDTRIAIADRTTVAAVETVAVAVIVTRTAGGRV